MIASFDEALLGVVGHVLQTAGLGRIDLQEAAFDAGMFVHAGRGIGSVTGAQSNASQEEVLLELFPFVHGGVPDFVPRPRLPSPFNKGVMGLDDVFGKDRCIATGGFQVEVP